VSFFMASRNVKINVGSRSPRCSVLEFVILLATGQEVLRASTCAVREAAAAL
jgi:hypothetical protein